MASRAEAALAIFQKRVGLEDGVGNWHKLEQSQINLFADATGDHQFIHVDPEKAAQLSPYKVTIAHGFLTLSLIPHLTASIPPPEHAYEGLVMGINYGLDRLRFPSPVKVDSRVRARRELVEARNKAEQLIYSMEKTLKEQEDKVDAAEKEEIEAKIKELEEARKGDDTAKITAAMEELLRASHKLAERIYKEAQPEPEQASAAGPGPAGAQPPPPPDDEQIIDADYEVK